VPAFYAHFARRLKAKRHSVYAGGVFCLDGFVSGPDGCHVGAKRWPGRFKRRAGREEQKNHRGGRSRQRRPMLLDLVELGFSGGVFVILRYFVTWPACRSPGQDAPGLPVERGECDFLTPLMSWFPPTFRLVAPFP